MKLIQKSLSGLLILTLFVPNIALFAQISDMPSESSPSSALETSKNIDTSTSQIIHDSGISVIENSEIVLSDEKNLEDILTEQKEDWGEDEDLKKYKSMDAQGVLHEETKAIKQKAKASTIESNLPVRIGNDGISLQSQNYKTAQPEVDRSTGALIYKYPLNIPDGRGELTPQVNIAYNSQSLKDGSSFGYGWSIDIPYVERLNKLGTDKMHSRNDFSHSSLGELKVVSGNNYGPKVDSGDFLSFSFTNNSWVVKDKQGNTYTYGSSTNSRQDDPSDSSKIVRWMLEKIEDVNGNAINFTYYKESGQIYISEIKYAYQGSNSLYKIVFSRAATSARKSYASNFLVENKYLINNIKIYTNNIVTKEYALQYNIPSVSSPFANINSITETAYSSSGNKSNTTSFQYADNNIVSNFATGSTFQIPADINRNANSQPDNWVLVDYNNDSLPDFVKCIVPTYGTPFSCNQNGGYKYYKNNGSTWVLDTNPTNLIPGTVLIPSNEAFFSDINGDKKVDVVVASLKKVYLHMNDGWVLNASTTTPVPIGSIDDYASNFLIHSSGVWIWSGWRNIDINNDNLLDFVLLVWDPVNSRIVERKKYLNTNNGFVEETANFQNNQGVYFTYYNGGSNNYPSGNFVDSNNDGVMDLTKNYVVPETVISLGNGSDWLSEFQNNYIPTSLQGNFMNFNVDLNGDGYLDYLYQDNTNGATNFTATNTAATWATKKVFLNQHDDTIDTSAKGPNFPTVSLGHYPAQIWYPCCNLYERKPLYFIDINGDGINDILEIVGSGEKNVYINPVQIPGLLKKVTTSAGGSYDFMYKSSAQYRDASNNSLNPDLSFIVQTLHTMTENDGLGNSGVTTYLYSGGSYYFNSPLDRSFAGFEKVVTQRPDGSKSITYFHQGNSSNAIYAEHADHAGKIGKIYREDVTNTTGNLFKRTWYKWDTANHGSEAWFTHVSDTVEQMYDGNSTHKDRATTNVYDTTNGNLLTSTQWGEVQGGDTSSFTDIGTDKRVTNILYAANTTLTQFAPKEITKVDNGGVLIEKAKFYYDNLAYGVLTKGNNTKTESFKDLNNFITTTKLYNVYGLVTEERDANNNPTTYVYDTYNLYPQTITNALGHLTSYTYDYATGKSLTVTTPNTLFSFSYDGFGRILEEKVPDAYGTSVAKATYMYTDTPNAISVKKSDYLDVSNIIDTYSYFDGLGRSIQTKKEAENGNWITRDTLYDMQGRIFKQSIPYFTQTFTKSALTTNVSLLSTNTYDTLDRLITQTNAVGTTGILYNDRIKTVTDPLARSTAFVNDAFGNLVSVTENVGGLNLLTQYIYNGQNKLTKITDANSNVRNFTYDTLGRRLTAEDIHAATDTTFGSYGFVYDYQGNLTEKTTPKNDVVSYTYDVLNRIKTEDFTGAAGVETTYTYDTCENGIGFLCDTRQSLVSKVFIYNKSGYIKKEVSEIDKVFFATDYEYDRQGNIQHLTSPNNDRFYYSYNNAGLLESVDYSQAGMKLMARSIISNVDYAPTGSPTLQVNGNGTQTCNTYNQNKLYQLTNKKTIGLSGTCVGGAQTSQNGRIAEKFQPATTTISNFETTNITTISQPILGNTIQNLSYTYDEVGNILSVADTASSSVVTTYTYDNVNRLLTATAPGFQETFTYDGIGNILTRNTVPYLYETPNKTNPHAVTKVGAIALTYDTNGNVLTIGEQTNPTTNLWNYKNELTQTTRGNTTANYLYDESGTRVYKKVGTLATSYPSPYFFQSNTGSSTILIMVGNDNIATIEDGRMLWNHTDHLGSTVATTDSQGKITEQTDYSAFGHQKSRSTYQNTQQTEKYTGHTYDPETDLLYAQARYFRGSLGRFLSQDALFWNISPQYLTDPEQMNSYSYAKNNPVLYIDPNGEKVELVVRPVLTKYDGHMFYHVTPDNPDQININGLPSGTKEFSIGGYNRGGFLGVGNKLIPEIGYGGMENPNTDSPYLLWQKDATARTTISLPGGQSDTGFINALGAAANGVGKESYFTLGQRLKLGNANSNNFVNEIGSQVGVGDQVSSFSDFKKNNVYVPGGDRGLPQNSLRQIIRHGTNEVGKQINRLQQIIRGN